MVKACLFDLDGVVFDTEPLYTLFWRNLDKRLRPNIDNFEHIIKGQTLVQIYDKYFAGEEKSKRRLLHLSKNTNRICLLIILLASRTL